MLKLTGLLIFLPTLFLMYVSNSIEKDPNSFPKPSPTRSPVNINEPANVENLILDRETVNLWCPATVSDNAMCSKKGMKIKVRTEAKDKENDVLTYHYTVSGGKITGQGEAVVWDLYGAGVGEYKITAGVDDGCGICGRTVTKTVNIVECDSCDPPCVCPTVSVSASKQELIYNGETIEFKARVSGGTQSKVAYNWAIKGGIILDGQGTQTIKIQVLTDKLVIALLEMDGLCPDCVQVASEAVEISK